jgi:hypothetical protein
MFKPPMHFDGEFTELRCHKLDIACQPFCCHHWEADCFASPHLTTPHNARVLKLTELSSLFVVAGFSSLFLYRRWYRCHVVLDSFAMDKGVIDRREHLSLKDFQAFYDGKKPVRFLCLLLIFTLNEFMLRCVFSIAQDFCSYISSSSCPQHVVID